MSDLSFERDIFPLFRARDSEAMSFAFDLSSYEDVCENARRSTRGWPTARCPAMHPRPGDVERVRRWIDAGMAA
jgi:hypothetical protein